MLLTWPRQTYPCPRSNQMRISACCINKIQACLAEPHGAMSVCHCCISGSELNLPPQPCSGLFGPEIRAGSMLDKHFDIIPARTFTSPRSPCRYLTRIMGPVCQTTRLREAWQGLLLPHSDGIAPAVNYRDKCVFRSGLPHDNFGATCSP